MNADIDGQRLNGKSIWNSFSMIVLRPVAVAMTRIHIHLPFWMQIIDEFERRKPAQRNMNDVSSNLSRIIQ